MVCPLPISVVITSRRSLCFLFFFFFLPLFFSSFPSSFVAFLISSVCSGFSLFFKFSSSGCSIGFSSSLDSLFVFFLSSILSVFGPIVSFSSSLGFTPKPSLLSPVFSMIVFFPFFFFFLLVPSSVLGFSVSSVGLFSSLFFKFSSSGCSIGFLSLLDSLWSVFGPIVSVLMILLSSFRLGL